MSAPSSITVNFGLTGLFVYLGIGILYHLITGDGPFMWSDPWLYVTMAIWPIFALGWVILVIIVVFLVVSLLWYLDDHKDQKRREKERKQRLGEIEERRRAEARATPSTTKG